MKMLKKEAEQRQAIEMLCTDMLVPKERLLCKIDAAVDFRASTNCRQNTYTARITDGPAVIR